MSKEYNKAWENFLEKQGESTPDFEVEFSYAWKACKEKVLEILNKPLENCDLSIDNCDKRYIEEIDKLL